MSGEDASLLDRLRQSEYTGENRCTPCTVVNLVIAVGVSGGVAVVAPPLGGAVFALSLLSIYFRGYLVPGTPQLTKRYMPDRLHRLFGTHPLDDEPEFEYLDELEAERENAVDQESFLQSHGVVEVTDDGSEYVFTESFEAAVDRHTDRATADVGEYAVVAEIFGVDPDAVEPQDREYPAVKIDIRIRKWPSEAAVITDVATHLAIAEFTDEWTDVPPSQRYEILEELRGYHDHCLACGGPVEFSHDVVESCCGHHEVKTYACADCGQHLREFDQKRVGSSEAIKGMTP